LFALALALAFIGALVDREDARPGLARETIDHHHSCPLTSGE
jgi:hypothetical protein